MAERELFRRLEQPFKRKLASESVQAMDFAEAWTSFRITFICIRYRETKRTLTSQCDADHGFPSCQRHAWRQRWKSVGSMASPIQIRVPIKLFFFFRKPKHFRGKAADIKVASFCSGNQNYFFFRVVASFLYKLFFLHLYNIQHLAKVQRVTDNSTCT
jgi:hypothetical protein